LKDAQDDAAKSAGGAAGGPNAYNEALKKLSPNARAFVEKIKELKPAWEEMQKAVQNSFFEGFADKTQQLSDKYLPELKSGLVGIAGAMNKMALYAADALMKPVVVEAVNNILGNTKELFDNAGTALGDFIEGFLKLASIGSDYLPAIGKWLADIARDFKDWVNANPDKIRGFISWAQGRRTVKASLAW
jgi:Sec-independent protein translocase protein TatA